LSEEGGEERRSFSVSWGKEEGEELIKKTETV
jgi:hypothetical protein